MRAGSQKASVVIPSMGGWPLLARYLPSVIHAVRSHSASDEIIVVEDGGGDDTASFLSVHFPMVRVIATSDNRGFIAASNLAIAHAQHELVVLLNNDIAVDEGFLGPLLRHFGDPLVFSVTPKMIRMTDGVDEGITRGFAKFGMLMTELPGTHPACAARCATTPILYGCGGAVALDKRKFARIGGFDELFAPGYGEDKDLGYRAWKQGWKVLYEPRSVVYHEHSATMEGLYSESARRLLASRNALLFMWKNMDDRDLVAKHLLFLLPFVVYRLVVKQDYLFPLALVQACGRLPAVIRTRQRPRAHRRRSDREVLALSDCLGVGDRVSP